MWQKPELELLHAKWDSAQVQAFFTCREGGVSSGPFGGVDGIMGLNLAMHTGDVPACVSMNRQIVASLLPRAPRYITQVHGVNVVRAERVENLVRADAAWTDQRNVVCAVMVADCLPVLFAATDGSFVGAIHAGWRSLADGIIQKTINQVRQSYPEKEIQAWLGPCIGADDFEVGCDVLQAMQQHLPQATQHFTQKENGQYLCDLVGLATDALTQVGVTRIRSDRLSTFADPKRFYSYRRDGRKSGRHVACIWRRAAE